MKRRKFLQAIGGGAAVVSSADVLAQAQSRGAFGTPEIVTSDGTTLTDLMYYGDANRINDLPEVIRLLAAEIASLKVREQ